MWLIDAGRRFVWDCVGVRWSDLHWRAGCPVSAGTWNFSGGSHEIRPRGGGLGFLGGLGYRAGSHIGISWYFSLGLFKIVKLNSVELSSVDKCSCSSS